MINCKEFFKNKTKQKNIYTHSIRDTLQRRASPVQAGRLEDSSLAIYTWPYTHGLRQMYISKLSSRNSVLPPKWLYFYKHSALSLTPNHFIDSKSKLINSQKNLKQALTIIQIREKYTPKTHT